MSRLDWHYHTGKDVEPGCDDCREKFEKHRSICAKCCQPVSNKIFLSSDYHFSGKCIAKYKDAPLIPERTVDKPCRPNLTAILRAPSDKTVLAQRLDKNGQLPEIETYADLVKFWAPLPKKRERGRKAA